MSLLARYIVSIGSNVSPVENLRRGVDLLRARQAVIQVATVWETPPVGASGANFYNTAVCLLSRLDPLDLKFSVLRPIEAELGRVRTSDKSAPRPIDFDAILRGGEILDSRLWAYAYLAIPIAELCPDLRHPQTHEHLADIAARLKRHTLAIPHPEVLGDIQHEKKL